MILVTGYTGNTGEYVVNQLLQMMKGKIVGVARTDLPKPGLITEKVDLNDMVALEKLFQKYSFTHVFHIAGIHFSRGIFEMAGRYNVKQLIAVHTTGMFSKYRDCGEEYQTIEKDVLAKRYSNMTYTVLRPTMIYGTQGDRNMSKLIRLLCKTPIFPVFGGGNHLMQPVHVEDVSHAVMNSFNNPNAHNKCFNISGANVITYKDLLKTIRNELKRQVIFLSIPHQLALKVVQWVGKYIRFPITEEQIRRLQEDKAFSYADAERDLNYRPRSFHEGIKQEIKLLRQTNFI